MATRRRQYLYIYESLAISIPESQLGSGKTLTAKFCESSRGDPSDIGTLTETAAAVSSSYDIEFVMADLVSQLGTDYVGKPVYLHLSDGVAWRDVYSYVVTDVDPDLLDPLT
jgi:hypothetical protein